MRCNQSNCNKKVIPHSVFRSAWKKWSSCLPLFWVLTRTSCGDSNHNRALSRTRCHRWGLIWFNSHLFHPSSSLIMLSAKSQLSEFLLGVMSLLWSKRLVPCEVACDGSGNDTGWPVQPTKRNVSIKRRHCPQIMTIWGSRATVPGNPLVLIAL